MCCQCKKTGDSNTNGGRGTKKPHNSRWHPSDSPNSNCQGLILTSHKLWIVFFAADFILGLLHWRLIRRSHFEDEECLQQAKPVSQLLFEGKLGKNSETILWGQEKIVVIVKGAVCRVSVPVSRWWWLSLDNSFSLLCVDKTRGHKEPSDQGYGFGADWYQKVTGWAGATWWVC